MLGDHVISVSVNDNTEVTTQSWNINVNYFSTECNNLQAGEICTFIGNPEVGHLSKPAESQANVRIRPIAVTGDGNGNIFFVDDHNRVVYFYNRSAK